MSFVVAHYTRFHNLSAIVRKYFCMSERKLREFLHLLQLSHFVLLTVWKTLLLELVREKATFCCGKSRCETYCKLKQADTFESFAAQKVYKINHSFNCNSKCSVYLFSCKVCGNQYVHSTVDIDFDSGRTSAHVAKGTHQMVEHSTKTISVNIF